MREAGQILDILGDLSLHQFGLSQYAKQNRSDYVDGKEGNDSNNQAVDIIGRVRSKLTHLFY